MPHRAHVLRGRPHRRHARDDRRERPRKSAARRWRRSLPIQREDFAGIFEAMDGFPVTIRTLDPPLHDSCRRAKRKSSDLAQEDGHQGSGCCKAKVESLHEANPMLGFRGCRLGITYPEITEMQARAIFEAARGVPEKGIKVLPEVMIPLVGSLDELQQQAIVIRALRRGDGGDRPAVRVHDRHHDRVAARRVGCRPDRRGSRVLLVRHQRPDADDLGLEPRRCRAIPAAV